MELLRSASAAAVATLAVSAGAGTLWDNGPFITTPGGGFGAADVSELQTAIGGGSLGYGAALFHGQSVADDFTLAQSSVIASITCFAYQTNAPTSGTMTGLFLRIWSGPPGEAGSVVIWGDRGEFLETNLMSQTFWTGAYRASDANPLDIARPIMALVADFEGIELPRGTYWLEWGASGSFALAGPLAPPVTEIGVPGHGNALRFNPKTFQWEDVIDGGAAGWHDDLPFIISGDAAGPPADLNGDGFVNAADLALLLGAWGKCPPEACAADLTGDGAVNAADLAILLGAWTV